MNTETEHKLIDSCRHNRVNKTTSLGSTERLSDADKYLSQTRFSEEHQKLFTQLPSIVAHASEVKPNAYVTRKTPLGAIVITRDEDSVSHVFYNSCRHRGAKVAKGNGCARRLVCPYHAWTYSMSGELSSVPGHSHCFPTLDKSDHGLLEIPSVEKFGFIWVCPAAKSPEYAEEHLEKHLGIMAEQLSWCKADNLKLYRETAKNWRGNWKLFAEGGLETYHFAYAHKDTIAPYFYNNTAVIDQLGRHFRVVMPTRAIESEQVMSLHDCAHTLFFVLPNSALLVQKNHVDWIEFRPISVDETQIVIKTLIPDDTENLSDDKIHHWDKNHKITNDTLDEDWLLGESIQESLQSGALKQLRYGKNEWALYAFNQLLDTLIAQ